MKLTMEQVQDFKEKCNPKCDIHYINLIDTIEVQQKEIELCRFYLHNHGKDSSELSDAVRDILFENDGLQLKLSEMSGTLKAISKVSFEASKGDEKNA